MSTSADEQLQDFIKGIDDLIEKAPEGSSPIIHAKVASSVSMSDWDPKYRTEIDLVGVEWNAIFEEAQKWVSKGALVAFLGDRGAGKTRMASEIARKGAWPRDKGEWNGVRTVSAQTASYRRAMDIFLDLRACLKKGAERTEKEILADLTDSGLLVIDEFQERGGSEWENQVITNLLDKRYAAERPTIIIANFDKAQLSASLSPSVKDRMNENGKSFIFNWGSYRRNKPCS